MSAMPRPPRLPGIKARSLSCPRRRKSSRSGGLGPPGVCGPEPHGPRDPEPHGPPDWLLHGINCLLGRRLVLTARAFVPSIWIYDWKVGIAINLFVNMSDGKMRRERHGLGVD